MPTLNSGRTPSASCKLTLPLLIPIISCTIAWYVHWLRSGVTGSFLRSRISSTGAESVLLKSKSEGRADCIWYWIWVVRVSSGYLFYANDRHLLLTWTSSPNFLARPLILSYRTTGLFLRLSNRATRPLVCLSKAIESHSWGECDHRFIGGVA